MQGEINGGGAGGGQEYLLGGQDCFSSTCHTFILTANFTTPRPGMV